MGTGKALRRPAFVVHSAEAPVRESRGECTLPVEMVMRLVGPLHGPPSFSQLHGAACAVVEAGAAGHTDQVKAFAVRPLVRHRPDLHDFSMALLRDDTTAVPGNRLRLGARILAVQRVVRQRRTWQDLAMTAPARAVDVVVHTPCFISRRGGRHLPLPEPVALAQGLARRWNTFAGAYDIPPVRVGDVLDSIEVLRVWGLETVRVPGGRSEGVPARTGFVGRVRFGVRSHDTQVQQDFASLFALAAFAGMGAETTHGFGVVSVDAADARLSPEAA